MLAIHTGWDLETVNRQDPDYIDSVLAYILALEARRRAEARPAGGRGGRAPGGRWIVREAESLDEE